MATEAPRVWFITGASSGIGRELARQALAAGEAVAAVSRHAAGPDGDLGPSDMLLTASADVRDQDSVRKAVEAAAGRFGRIDVVANNAGYGLSDALAAEVAPLGIKVTLIQPGLVATPFLGNLDTAAATEPDYDQTVRLVQQTIGSLPASAFASVEAVAAGIRTAVDSDNPPLRLALGATGASEMRAALVARIADLDQWAAVTSAAGA
jgi:NAD(P)-dependent dehydrogenase (short-subunit alcohol dehydrogenase family)